MSAHIVIDCGTTNLRATLLDERLEVLGTERAMGGVRHTAIDGNNDRLKRMLRETIERLLERHGYEPEEIGQCVAYGMITSNMGLLEIPHLAAPASERELRAGMREASFPEIAPFPIRFIPGVRNFAGEVTTRNFSDMDMMRGEETEAIGLYHLLKLDGPAILVLPGSHNKFVLMGENGEIRGCMTSISGELLDAITHHTVIADAVGRGFVDPLRYNAEMACHGAWECAGSGIGRAAFAGRILSMLGGMSVSDVQSYLLGATLSQDVMAMRSFAKGMDELRVFVAGKPPVQQAMCDVIEALEAGEAEQVSPEISQKMGLCGVRKIAF